MNLTVHNHLATRFNTLLATIVNSHLGPNNLATPIGPTIRPVPKIDHLHHFVQILLMAKIVKRNLKAEVKITTKFYLVKVHLVKKLTNILMN